LFERRDEAALDRPIRTVMAAKPTTVRSGMRVADAVVLLAKRKFSELPVVDKAGRPIGLVDVTDIVGIEVDTKSATASPKKAA
jgi:arabinose-5-phosphate isomerase